MTEVISEIALLATTEEPPVAFELPSDTENIEAAVAAYNMCAEIDDKMLDKPAQTRVKRIKHNCLVIIDKAIQCITEVYE